MSQELAKKPAPTEGVTGSTCTKTGLYKATDGRMEFVRLIKQDEKYPAYPGGTGSTKTTWTAVSSSTDGSREGFESVKVSAGSA